MVDSGKRRKRIDSYRALEMSNSKKVACEGKTAAKGDHNIPLEDVKDLERHSDCYHPRQHKAIVRFLFVCFVLTQIFVNYDSGAIPSVLENITQEFELSETLLGLLGALPYIGLVVACPIVGALFQKVAPKKILLISISSNIGAVVMLAFSFNVYLLYTSRFLLGVTQSGFCIYAPVWIDEFAPESAATMWMGLIQGGTVFGVMLGYLVTGYIRPWRVSATIQAAVLFVFLFVFIFTPRIYIDLYDSPPHMAEEIGNENRNSVNPNTPKSSKSQNYPVMSKNSSLRKLATLQRIKGHTLELTVKSESPRAFPSTPAMSSSSSSGVTSTPAGINLSAGAHFFGNRAPTLMTPSPAGAVLESLEISAGYDMPLVLRRTSTSVIDSADHHPPLPSAQSEVQPNEKKKGSRGLWYQLKLLFDSKIYVWTVVTLCALLYVVTGIQYWSTKWFIVSKHTNENYVRVVFSSVAATGPTIGVFLGAFLIDRLGGYKAAKGMYRSLWFCLMCGSLATAAGIFASFLEHFAAIIVMIWFLLFFGGAILPPATGILIAAVDPSVRPLASSISMFAYNILGYGLGTFLPGPFMTAYGLDKGMMLIFFWSFFGVFGMSMALFFAWKDSVVPLEVQSSRLGTLSSMQFPVIMRKKEGREGSTDKLNLYVLNEHPDKNCSGTEPSPLTVLAVATDPVETDTIQVAQEEVSAPTCLDRHD